MNTRCRVYRPSCKICESRTFKRVPRNTIIDTNARSRLQICKSENVHASVRYSLLHLAGYDSVAMDDLKQFRLLLS